MFYEFPRTWFGSMSFWFWCGIVIRNKDQPVITNYKYEERSIFIGIKWIVGIESMRSKSRLHTGHLFKHLSKVWEHFSQNKAEQWNKTWSNLWTRQEKQKQSESGLDLRMHHT